MKLEVEVSHERKLNEDKEEEMSKYVEIIHYHEESDYDEYNEMRDAIESEGKEWRENYQRMKFKFRKL